MQRLLHEGMEAGLAGLLDPAPRAELGAGRLRRHADGHRHDGRRGHPRPGRGAGRARRGLDPDHPGRGPARTRGLRLPRDASPRSPSARSSTTPSPSRRNNADVHRKPLAWIEGCRKKGLPIFAQCATVPRRVRLHARALEPLRRLAGVARRHHRHARPRRSRRCRTPSCARRSSTRPRRPTSGCRRSRPASAATPPGSSSRASTATQDLEQLRRPQRRRDRRGGGQAPRST